MMKIEHAAAYFKDLEGAKKFFETYFNAKSNDLYHNQKTGFKSYFLTFEEGARLEIMTRENLKSVEDDDYYTGYVHLAFSVGSKEAVDELTAKLKNDGYEVLSGPRTTGDGYYESCVSCIEKLQVEAPAAHSTSIGK